MSLFDSASLVITPNGVKAGKLYALKGDDLNVVRATSATRVNASGLIELVGANVPRLDYTNVTCPSILVEPQRTNVIDNSNNFVGSNWSSLLNTITPNYAISPDGTLNATRLQSTKANSSLDSYLINTFSDGSFATPVKSIYIKGVSSGGSLILGSSTINFTTEWKIYNITDSFPYFLIGARVGFNNIDVLIYGAQLEYASYATSYIPTTSSSVTRNADVISDSTITGITTITETFEDNTTNVITSPTSYTMSQGRIKSVVGV